MARGWKALKGWRRRCLARTRTPHCLAIWTGIAWELIRGGFWLHAVYLLFLVVAYMRPSEPLTVRRGDLVAPTAGVSRAWHVQLYPEERPARSKTYAANDSVELTAKWAPWLGTVCEALSQGPQDELIFGFDYGEFLEQFRAITARLGLEKATPYQARHSGPSIDLARGERTLPEVKARGRWLHDKSVTRYERRARLAVSLQRMSASKRAFCEETERRFEALVLGRAHVSDIVWPLT